MIANILNNKDYPFFQKKNIPLFQLKTNENKQIQPIQKKENKDEEEKDKEKEENDKEKERKEVIDNSEYESSSSSSSSSSSFSSDSTIQHDFIYLDGYNNPLAQHFSEITSTSKKEKKIHLCIYKINRECKIPFLQFCFHTNEKQEIDFPTIHNFKCPTFRKGKDQENTFFLNKCLQLIIELLNIEDEFDIELFQKMYKGFIEKDDFTIYVLYEYFENKKLNYNLNLHWSILDEILYHQQINKKPIQNHILSFFHENKYLTEIINPYSHTCFPFPFLLYKCIPQKSTLPSTAIQNIKNCMIHDTIIDETFFLLPFGNFHYFSSIILDNDLEDITTIQKYAVFTEKARYILQDLDEITEKQHDNFLKKETNQNILTIYFSYYHRQLWCIKNRNYFSRIE